MSYCTTNDVLAVVDTDMTASEIDVLIDIYSAVMTAVIPTGSLDSQILRGICQTWCAYRVMLKDPNSRSIGGYSENRTETLSRLKGELDMMLGIGGGGISFTAACEDLS